MLSKTAYQFVDARSLHMRTHLFCLTLVWGAFIAAHSCCRSLKCAWRRTARFLVQIFWEFSCKQIVFRRKIAQQFLACETVGLEVLFWAERLSFIQVCPFSLKPCAWTGSFVQVATNMFCLTLWGFIAACSAEIKQMIFKQNTLTCRNLTSCFQNIQPYLPVSVYHICFQLSLPGMLHNAASTI